MVKFIPFIHTLNLEYVASTTTKGKSKDTEVKLKLPKMTLNLICVGGGREKGITQTTPPNIQGVEGV